MLKHIRIGQQLKLLIVRISDGDMVVVAGKRLDRLQVHPIKSG